MGTNSIFGEPVKTIKTVCIDGVYIIDNRISYNRRNKMHKHQKKYERRLCNKSKNIDRRNQLIDIIV